MTDLPAGNDLDKLIATRVMGLTLIQGYDITNYCYHVRLPDGKTERLKPYSKDISAAWEVVEHLAAKKPALHIELEHYSEGWTASFLSFDPYEDFAAWRLISKCDGETAPYAISLAALKAVGSDTKAVGYND